MSAKSLALALRHQHVAGRERQRRGAGDHRVELRIREPREAADAAHGVTHRLQICHYVPRKVPLGLGKRQRHDVPAVRPAIVEPVRELCARGRARSRRPRNPATGRRDASVGARVGSNAAPSSRNSSSSRLKARRISRAPPCCAALTNSSSRQSDSAKAASASSASRSHSSARPGLGLRRRSERGGEGARAHPASAAKAASRSG